MKDEKMGQYRVNCPLHCGIDSTIAPSAKVENSGYYLGLGAIIHSYKLFFLCPCLGLKDIIYTCKTDFLSPCLGSELGLKSKKWLGTLNEAGVRLGLF